MTHENSKSADEAAVRAVIDAITSAVRAKDVEALLSHCAPDIATFDMVPPSSTRARKRFAASGPRR